MLYTLSKNTTSSLAIESAMDELRQIIGHRIQANLNQNQFLFGKYVSEKLPEPAQRKIPAYQTG